MCKHTIGIKVFQTIESVSLFRTSFRTVNESSVSTVCPAIGLQVSPDYADLRPENDSLFTQFLSAHLGLRLFERRSRQTDGNVILRQRIKVLTNSIGQTAFEIRFVLCTASAGECHRNWKKMRALYFKLFCHVSFYIFFFKIINFV